MANIVRIEIMDQHGQWHRHKNVSNNPMSIKQALQTALKSQLASKSKKVSSNSGLGLGSFLGKTLLERQGADLLFKRNGKLGGALVVIIWNPKTFTNI